MYSKHWNNFNTCEDHSNASVHLSPNTKFLELHTLNSLGVNRLTPTVLKVTGNAVFKHLNNLENKFIKTRVSQLKKKTAFSRGQNDMVNYTETWVWVIRQDCENTECFFILQYESGQRMRGRETYQLKNEGQKVLAIYYWTQKLLRILMKES